jgi:hypothetical protein
MLFYIMLIPNFIVLGKFIKGWHAMGLTYKDSGVNVEGGNNFVNKIAPFVKKSFTDRVWEQS